ncbi:MAG: hypothetical protein ABW036_12035 [Flavitalea sp.]
MSSPGLLTRQLFLLGLYFSFFAVQLHYKYVYIYAASNYGKSQVSAGDEDPGPKFSKGPVPGSQHKFNLKINKRFIPTDCVVVSPISIRIDITIPQIKRAITFTSNALITQTGLIMTDRGPPTDIFNI